MDRRSITIKEGDYLWPLMELLRDTHIDDFDESRMRQVMDMIRGWRITHADGSRLEPHERYPRPEVEMVEAANCTVGIYRLRDGGRCTGIHFLDAEGAPFAMIHFNAGGAERLWCALGEIIVDLRAGTEAKR